MAVKVCSKRNDKTILVVESKDEGKVFDTDSSLFNYKPAFFKEGLYLVNFIKSKVDMPCHEFLDQKGADSGLAGWRLALDGLARRGEGAAEIVEAGDVDTMAHENWCGSSGRGG